MSHPEESGLQRSAVVGITSCSPGTDLAWLKDFLCENFLDHVFEVRNLPISNSCRSQWERCAAAIFHHSMHQGPLNITDEDGALHQELQCLHTTLGRERILVVLDDTEDCSEEERLRILQTQPRLARLSDQLILIPKHKKHKEAFDKGKDFFNFLDKAVGKISQLGNPFPSSSAPFPASSAHSDVTGGGENNKSEGIYNKPKKQITNVKSHINTICRSSEQKRRIRIFSRAAESNYTWLLNGLKAEPGMESADIKGVYITNNYKEFREQAENCQFAILYHTLKHGRVNITDVTDSMYDEELQDLSGLLGKENVIVVVDDLKKGDYDEKKRILESQPSISQHAQELFVFTKIQKNRETLKEIFRIMQKDLQTHPTHESNTRHQIKANSWSPGLKALLNKKGFVFGRESGATQNDSYVDQDNGQEPYSKPSTSNFGSRWMTPLRRKDDDLEPPAKKMRSEAGSDSQLKQVWGVISEKLGINSATSKKVTKKIENLLTVQQMEQMMRSQEERIIGAVTALLQEKEVQLGNMIASLMEQKMEIQKKEEKLMKLRRKLQARERKLVKSDTDLSDVGEGRMTGDEESSEMDESTDEEKRDALERKSITQSRRNAKKNKVQLNKGKSQEDGESSTTAEQATRRRQRKRSYNSSM